MPRRQADIAFKFVEKPLPFFCDDFFDRRNGFFFKLSLRAFSDRVLHIAEFTLPLFGTDKGDRRSRSSRPARAPDTMHVRRTVERKGIIDDVA